MTPLWILDLASALSLAMAAWSEEEKEKLECLREWLRNVCLTCGLNKNTESLGHLWCMITAAQVKVCGYPGDDIGTDSMGVPSASLHTPPEDERLPASLSKAEHEECTGDAAEVKVLRSV